MSPRDLLRESIESLASHRVRAVLSALGVVAGSGTVVAALAIAGGARQQAIAEIGALGVDNVLVRSVAASNVAKPRVPVLTLDDGEAIARPFIGASIAALRSIHDTVELEGRSQPATIAGVTTGWRQAMRLSVATGRWIDPRDAATRVAVLGADLAQLLFHGDDPIGRMVLAAGEWRTIVGVIARGGPRASPGAVETLDAGRTLFVPFGSLDVSLGTGDAGDSVEQLVLQLAPGDDPVLGGATVAQILSSRHDGQPQAFEVIVPQALLDARLRSERSSRILFVSIGVLALLVGGAGILNMMVSSVAERSPEIGVRRAVGARRGAIVGQFAAEAALLGSAGGVIGVPLGALAAVGVAAIAGWPIAVTASAVVTALALALVVGVGAGIYPAYLAASLSPIEALRQ